MLSKIFVGLLASSLCSASPLIDVTSLTPRAPHANPRIRLKEKPDDYPVLKPVVHWDHQSDLLEHLQPKTAHQLYFASTNPNEAHTFLDLEANFGGKAVILDHSSFITSVTCSNDTIDIQFSTKKAYNYAKEHWGLVKDFMLVTNSDTCGARTQERSFWDVTSMTFGDKLTLCAGVAEEKGIEHVLDDAKMQWGHCKMNMMMVIE